MADDWHERVRDRLEGTPGIADVETVTSVEGEPVYHRVIFEADDTGPLRPALDGIDYRIGSASITDEGQLLANVGPKRSGVA